MDFPLNRRGWACNFLGQFIVVGFIGILAAMAIPRFSVLIRKSSEGACKGNLGALRSALALAYHDNCTHTDSKGRSWTAY